MIDGVKLLAVQEIAFWIKITIYIMIAVSSMSWGVISILIGTTDDPSVIASYEKARKNMVKALVLSLGIQGIIFAVVGFFGGGWTFV